MLLFLPPAVIIPDAKPDSRRQQATTTTAAATSEMYLRTSFAFSLLLFSLRLLQTYLLQPADCSISLFVRALCCSSVSFLFPPMLLLLLQPMLHSTRFAATESERERRKRKGGCGIGSREP